MILKASLHLEPRKIFFCCKAVSKLLAMLACPKVRFLYKLESGEFSILDYQMRCEFRRVTDAEIDLASFETAKMSQTIGIASAVQVLNHEIDDLIETVWLIAHLLYQMI